MLAKVDETSKGPLRGVFLALGDFFWFFLIDIDLPQLVEKTNRFAIMEDYRRFFGTARHSPRNLQRKILRKMSLV